MMALIICIKNCNFLLVVVTSLLFRLTQAAYCLDQIYLLDLQYQDSTEKIIDLIESVPTKIVLPLLPENSESQEIITDEVVKINSILRALEKYKVCEIRSAICEILSKQDVQNWKQRAETHEKIFLITKGLFSIPEVVDRATVHFEVLVQATGIPINYADDTRVSNDDFVYGNWPWSITTPKHFVPERRIIRSSYLKYEPLETFDYFQKNFKYLGAAETTGKPTIGNDREASPDLKNDERKR